MSLRGDLLAENLERSVDLMCLDRKFLYALGPASCRMLCAMASGFVAIGVDPLDAARLAARIERAMRR